MRRARLIPLLAVLTGLLAVAAPAARALPPLTMGFADAVLSDPGELGASTATQSFWLGKAASIGAGVVRVNVDWQSVAPTVRPRGFNPTAPGSVDYYWTPTDEAVRAIIAHGMKPLLMIYLAPLWAEGPNPPAVDRPGTWEPNATQFAEFALAAARRYSGRFPDPLHRGRTLPAVRLWQAWNEPNLQYYLNPLWTSNTASGLPRAPTIYRALLNGFYASVKRVSKANVVLAAGTAPYGDPPQYVDPNGQRMYPLVFDRALFCLDPRVPCSGPVYLDGIDHHPYQSRLPPQYPVKVPGDVGIPELHSIVALLHAGQRAGHVLPAGHKQVWVGELSWDSNPPSQNPGISVPLADQACNVELAQYLLYEQGADHIVFLQIHDQAPLPPWTATYRWGGMYFYGGQPKPALTAYEFPLVADPLSKTRIRVWGRAPASGTVLIERRSGGRWPVVARVSVGRGSVFEVGLRGREPAAFRAQLGAVTSLPWTAPRAACPVPWK
jgi:hypothetical protein